MRHEGGLMGSQMYGATGAQTGASGPLRSDADKTTHKFWPLYRQLCAMRRQHGGDSEKAFRQFKAKYGKQPWFPTNQQFLKVNGTEPEFRYKFWFKDHPECATANNCYAYALGAIRHEKGDGSNGYLGAHCAKKVNKLPDNQHVEGNINQGTPVKTIEDMCETTKRLILCDINKSYAKQAYLLRDEHHVPDPGFHRMAAVFDKQSDKVKRADYHYYLSHACGIFSHKSGWSQLPKFHDAKGRLILNPMKAARNYGDGINYNVACAWIAVPNRRRRKPVPAPTGKSTPRTNRPANRPMNRANRINRRPRNSVELMASLMKNNANKRKPTKPKRKPTITKRKKPTTQRRTKRTS